MLVSANRGKGGFPWYPPNRGLGCYHTGLYTEHEDGSSMPCLTQQCNHCSCRNGHIRTTLMRCYEDSCFKDGIEYKHGSTVPNADGCNSCGCFNGKLSICTLVACSKSQVITGILFFIIPYSCEQKHVSISDTSMLLYEIDSISNMGCQKLKLFK